jgi:hypothetical protein
MAEAPVLREVSEEDLRAAYVVCRERAKRKAFAAWPDTFEAAITDPMLTALIRVQARMGNRHLAGKSALEPAPTPAPRHIAPAAAPPRPQYHFKPPQPGAVDMKRRASGERDDD